jgi:hypothetical protein
MDDDHSEPQKPLNVMVTQATVNGVPLDKL